MERYQYKILHFIISVLFATHNGRAIKWNIRFLLLLFGLIKCFWASDCTAMRNLGDKSFFPEVITLRYPCIKWESVQWFTVNLQFAGDNYEIIRDKINLTKNNVIRYGNSVGLVWEKSFCECFPCKVLSKEHTVAIR